METLPSRISSMPCPFAGDSDAAITLPGAGSEESTMNFHRGFGANFGVPGSSGGKYVTRAEMNGLGRAATQDMFYHKCGGLNTFDPDFAEAVGGYPIGAVLQIMDDGRLFFVVSLKQNNKIDFRQVGVDGINWRYCYESKYDLDEESVVANVSTSNSIPYSDETTLTIFSKKIQRSGFLTVRNLECEIADGGGSWHSNTPTLAGRCVVATTVSPDEMDSFKSMSNQTTSAEASKWKIVSRLPSVRAPGLFTGQVSASGTVTYSWTLSEGLIYINQGDYLFVSILNGYDYSSGFRSDIQSITKLNFDLFVI